MSSDKRNEATGRNLLASCAGVHRKWNSSRHRASTGGLEGEKETEREGEGEAEAEAEGGREKERETEREEKGAKQKQRGISVVGGGGRSGRSALLSSSGRVICEDAPVVVITWDLPAPEGARGPHGPSHCRERDRQILIVIMASDVPRSWHVYASRFEAALATNRG